MEAFLNMKTKEKEKVQNTFDVNEAVVEVDRAFEIFKIFRELVPLSQCTKFDPFNTRSSV